MTPQSTPSAIDRALQALGIQRLVLAIHDVSFPSRAEDDLGRGSPYAGGGHDFFAFTRSLGFTGVLLGPQGQTSRGNASPYDGSVFSKNVLSIAFAELATPRFASLLGPDAVPRAVVSGVSGDESRAYYTHAFDAAMRLLSDAASSLRARAHQGDAAALVLAQEIADFAARAPWLAHDASFEAFAALHGNDDWRTWPRADQAPSAARRLEVEQQHPAVLDAYRLGQYLLDVQHRALRTTVTEPLGLRLYGDLQVGLSLRDRWCRGALFLDGYRMGAPPSRTNPEGQPWGYPVFDPRQYQARFVGVSGGTHASDAFADRPLAFVRARLVKLFAELDGVRVDHPHGLVCPWVYDAAAPDPMAAVIAGARLFETPASAAHPALAAFAIVTPDQLNPDVTPFDDEHVHGLRPGQVDAYDDFFALVMAEARAAGRHAEDVLCEVLSTCPAPLAAVMERHALGRFRVTQKASLIHPEDGYRGENAHPRDWTMIGNHDTEPLRAVVARWAKAGTLPARAEYLATRLEPVAARRAALASSLAEDPRRLAQAMFAELFVGPAANVLVFFADLFGELSTYNTPGLVSDANWSMRVPRAFREQYDARRRDGDAPDLPRALAQAMRARGATFAEVHAELLVQLDALAA